MSSPMSVSRRSVLAVTFAASSGIALGDNKAGKAGAGEEEEVSPTEDLMREHGLLNRVLLLYDDSVRKLDAQKDFDPAVLAGGADIIQRFIENYHEKLEEDHLFPRFEKAGKLTDLVAVLREQHKAGRRVTAQIQQLASVKTLHDTTARRQLADSLR